MSTEEFQMESIFYSWQSDLPNATNRNAIRKSLRAASSKLEEIQADGNLQIVLDEATRNKAGSPNIPLTILEKISTSDIFVCDITTINPDAPVGQRKVPNPNVIFELGYAVHTLGWERIIMLFNKNFGVASDVPFDIDRQRISYYYLSDSDNASKKKSDAAELTKLIEEALDAIIKSKPLRPSETKLLSIEEVQKKRDVENLNWILSSVHIPSIDEFIEYLPNRIDSSIFHFQVRFSAIFNSRLFHVFDQETYKAIQDFNIAWNNCLLFGRFYQAIPGTKTVVFYQPKDRSMSTDELKAWRKIVKAAAKLHHAFGHLISLVRKKYIEIDLDKLSHEAIKEYIQISKVFEK